MNTYVRSKVKKNSDSDEGRMRDSVDVVFLRFRWEELLPL